MKAKRCGLAALLLLISVCGAADVPVAPGGAAEWVERTADAFQDILDGAGLAGSILVLEASTGRLYSNDHVDARRGSLPASTFKIPHSIIALEHGIVEDENTLLPWDGEARRMSAWDRDMIVREAFHLSCVPCYQALARAIGTERMARELERFAYGSMVFDSPGLDRFWLEGASTISPREQIDFLRRFYDSQLSIRPRTEAIVRRMMVIEDNAAGTLSGKTGWVVRDGHHAGWFVGYLEARVGTYFVATRVAPLDGADTAGFLEARRAVSLEALHTLGAMTE